MAISVPLSTTVTNHGLIISAAGGPVGAITSWQPGQTRTVTPVYAFGDFVTGANDVVPEVGEPYEMVPGNIGGTQITINRYDIYTQRFERAFGTNDLTMLTQQNQSIRLNEYWATPDGDASFTNIYYGCWFTNLGRTMDAKADRIVQVSASAMYARKRALG